MAEAIQCSGLGAQKVELTRVSEHNDPQIGCRLFATLNRLLPANMPLGDLSRRTPRRQILPGGSGLQGCRVCLHLQLEYPGPFRTFGVINYGWQSCSDGLKSVVASFTNKALQRFPQR